jgi:UDP-N-acetylglucosamine 2-epimerase (non-hydrolysing)
VSALAELALAVPVLFPLHPRTRAQLEQQGLMATLIQAGVRCLEPAGYLDFLGLEIGARAIVTDSGGVQEEASALGVPCYTLRPNTERPVTVRRGTNTLLGKDPAAITGIRFGARFRRRIPIEGWDGRAGHRIAQILVAQVVPELEEVVV